MLRNTLIRFWPIVALVVLFAASILLRLPSFSIDPVKDQGWTHFDRWNNTEVWLHDQYDLNVYATHSAREHKFAAYVGADPQFLASKDDPALTVYTSFPPTHFIALYDALTAFGGHYTYQAMQVFSLALHALCVALIAYLVFLLTRDKLWAVLGGSMYIFSTGTLWYHMNVYWAHQLLMPVFLAALIVFVRRKGLLRWWQSLLLGFAMSVITWTGSVAVLGFALYGAYKFYKTRDRAYLGYLCMVGGMVIALGLILLQVLLATGTSIPEYLQKVLHRAQVRSTGATTMPLPVMAWQFANDLLLDYGGYMLIAYTLALRRKLRGFEREVLFVAAFPAVESFVLLEHDTTYGFGRLKWLVPVILVASLAGKRYATTKKRRTAVTIAVVGASVLHIALYYVVFQKT